MRCGSGPERAQPGTDRGGGTPCARASAAAARALATRCGAGSARVAAQVVERRELGGRVRRSSTKARSARTSSTSPTSDETRDAQGEADRTASLLHVGLLDEAHRCARPRRCRRRPPRCLVDPALGGGVLVDRAVPVDVVGGDVEAGRGTGASDCDQCSWKLESSTAMTSNGSGCSTASRIGVPTLPALHARSPAAARIDGQHLHRGRLAVGAGDREPGRRPVRARIRQASSTSPQTGTPAAAAAARSGWSGRHPGR